MVRPRIRRFSSPTRFIVENWAKARPDLDPSDYLFLVHVMRLGRLIERLHDRYCRATFQMSGADVNVLIMVRRTQVDHLPRPAELAESQMVTTGAITKQLDRLERQGFVRRRPREDMRGGLAVAATDAGIRLADRAMSDMVAASALGGMVRALSAQERGQATRICEKLLLEYETQ